MGWANAIGRALTVLLKILEVIVLLSLSFCVALPRGINDLKAANWAWSYSKLPHPGGTERIILHSGIDKFSNGDHCDFILLEARTYAPEHEAEIRLYYSTHWPRTEPYSASIRPDFIEGQDDVYNFEPYRQFSIDVERIHSGPYYILSGHVMVENYPPLVDWRCV